MRTFAAAKSMKLSMDTRLRTWCENNISTLADLYKYSVREHASLKASVLLDDDTQNYTYAQMGEITDRLSAILSEYGVGAGDKVAILSQNMPHWTAAYFSVTAYGRVVVPILAESSATEVGNILEHSGTVAVFVSKAKAANVAQEYIDKMNVVIELDSLEIIAGRKAETPAATGVPAADDLAGIFYTSGTTGRAKGVMLSHRNLCQNVIAAWYAAPFVPSDCWLSILPMAHTYEMAFDMLYPFCLGSAVHYLKKAPTTSVLTAALAQVRPQVICSVPLIIDKIYRSSVRKTIEKSRVLSRMERIAPSLLYRIIGKKLLKFFGGNLKFFGIGGAKLDPVIEAFLIKARFPYAIGYGLTETAPLITCTKVFKGRCGTIGTNAHNVQVRLGDIDPETGNGEIQCKGPNVMLGYYKDPERTAGVFTNDGWFRTGDLASRDKKGFYAIRGRIGTMIVGPSGENIYPEEIESVINNLSGVNESLVVNRDGKLVALVKFDESVIDWNQENEDKFFKMIEDKKNEIMAFVNKNVRKSNNINEVEIVKQPFAKTATMKIRRFLYQKTQKKDEK